jgi:hypothetical protein
MLTLDSNALTALLTALSLNSFRGLKQEQSSIIARTNSHHNIMFWCFIFPVNTADALLQKQRLAAVTPSAPTR